MALLKTDASTQPLRNGEFSIERPAFEILRGSGDGIRRKVDPQRILRHDGDSDLHVVEDGWAVEERTFEDGRRLIIDFVIPGDVIGLNHLFLDQSGGEVMSLTEMRTVTISGNRLVQRLSAEPGLAASLLKIHLDAAARMNERLLTLGRSAWERTAYLFLELWVRMSRRGLADGLSFHLPASQAVLADATGLSTVHFNRTLQQLRRDRVVRFERGRVTLLDPEELAESLCVALDWKATGSSPRLADSGSGGSRQQAARSAAAAFLE